MKHLEWRTICVTGPEGNGSQVVVDPEAVIGPFAVHPRIHMGETSGPGYTITHRQTGRAVWHTREFANAVKAAQWLDTEKIIPEDREGAMRWKATASLRAQTSMNARLQELAPRFVLE